MYRYTIEFWDETDNKVASESGLVGAQDWGDACSDLVEYYGKSNVVSIKLSPWENVVPDDQVEEGLRS